MCWNKNNMLLLAIVLPDFALRTENTNSIDKNLIKLFVTKILQHHVW